MNSITLPVVPLGAVVVVNFFAPYLVSLLVAQSWAAKTKQMVGAAVSIVLTAFALCVIHFGFGISLGDNIWLVVLLGLMAMFSFYDTFHKQLADALTMTKGVGSITIEPTDIAKVTAPTVPSDAESSLDLSGVLSAPPLASPAPVANEATTTATAATAAPETDPPSPAVFTPTAS